MAQGGLDDWTEAWAVFRAAPVPWAVLYGVYTAVALGTVGLGLVFAPNVIRITRDALEAGAAPSLDFGRIFDTSNLQEDAIAVVLFFGSILVAGSVLGPLSGAVGILLGFVPPLVADGRPAVTAIQDSVRRVLADPVPSVVHGVIANLLILPAICCFPLFPVALPIGAIATWKFYQANKPALLGASD